MKWEQPDEEALVQYLCGDRQFSEERVRSGAKKIVKSKSTATQGRLDAFFKVLPSTTPPVKRKTDEKKGNANKKVKGGGGRKPK